MLTPPLSIAYRAEPPGAVRIHVTGEVDMDTCADLLAALLGCVDDPATEQVLLDMSGITFIDSSGIRALMEGHNRATQQDKTLRVVDWTPGTRRVFDLLGLADALEEGPGPGA